MRVHEVTKGNRFNELSGLRVAYVTRIRSNEKTLAVFYVYTNFYADARRISQLARRKAINHNFFLCLQLTKTGRT